MTPTWITRRVLSSMMKNACERSKEEIVHLQEIASPDICRVIVQESAPLLSSGLRDTNMLHVLLNGPLAYVNVQFE